ncbi:MAG: hypothetical protein O3C28_20310, partial [Proteobacteria bacterium]|nr:hypothetical protein [Pseudomonadota bacterium]
MKACLFALLLLPTCLLAENPDTDTQQTWSADPPELSSLVTFARQESDLRVATIRFVEDRKSIERRYEVQYSPARHQRLREFLNGWRQQLQKVDFESLNHEGQIDYIALRNKITYDIEMLALDVEKGKEIAAQLPFGDHIRLLQENRHDRIRANPRETATILDNVATQIDELTAKLENDANNSSKAPKRDNAAKVVARRAASHIDHL